MNKKIKEVLDYKISMLIDLLLTDGVMPADLSDNIFLEDYVSISYYKRDANIIGELKIQDDTKGNTYKLIYKYTKEKRLISIKEILNNTTNILWSRESREEDLINDILFMMEQIYSNDQIIMFIKTLPNEIGAKILNRLNVA